MIVARSSAQSLWQDSAALKEKTRSISQKTPVSPSLLGGKLIPAFAVTPSLGCDSAGFKGWLRQLDICVTHRVEVRIFTESINSGCSASFVDAFGAVTQLGTVLCKCKCKIRSLESILDLCHMYRRTLFGLCSGFTWTCGVVPFCAEFAMKFLSQKLRTRVAATVQDASHKP
eukprot:s6195_g2.t1